MNQQGARGLRVGRRMRTGHEGRLWRALALLLLLAMVLNPVAAAPAAASPAAQSAAPTDPAATPAPALTAATFADPPAEVRPKYRWWHPLASTTDAEIIAELQQMKDLGAGGAEIDAFRASTGDSYQSTLDTNNNPYLATYGWGTSLWMHRIQVALQAAKNLGLSIDQGQGPRWPPSFPTLDSPNQDAVAKQLIYGKTRLAVGLTGTITIPVSFDQTLASRSTATCAAAASGDSTVKVANGYGLTAGDVIRIGSTTVETVTLTSVTKGATSSCTTLAAPAAAGGSKLYVTNVSGIGAGDSLIVGTGTTTETVTVGSVGSAKNASSATTLSVASAAGATNLKVAGVTFNLGDVLFVDTGSSVENSTVSAIGTQSRSTTLSAASSTGATNIKVASVTGMSAGDTLDLDTGSNLESAVISSVGTAGASGTGVTLASALTKAHASAAAVLDEGTGITVSPALTLAHAKGVAVFDGGTGVTLASALTKAHAAGDPLTSATVKSSITFTPALGSAHSALDTVTDQAKKTLVAALLAQCASSACSTAPIALDFNSVQDVTSLVTSSGKLTISDVGNVGHGYDFSGGALPTGNGNPWWVIDFYMTADGQVEEGFTTTSPNYVVDYLSSTGATATSNFYEGKSEPGSDYTTSGLLSFSDTSVPNYDSSTPTIQSLITAIGKFNIFDDSFELSNGHVRWTGGLPSYWASRRGYDLTRYLPALAGVGAYGMTTPAFDFTTTAGGSQTIGQRVRIDYRQTLSDLYITQYAQTVKTWANNKGITTRSQIYGASIDEPYGNAYVDVPEGESLTLGGDPEKNKLIAAGAHVQGRSVMSFECCAGFGGVGNTLIGGSGTVLSGIYKGMAGGVNQLVWHGFAYLTAPNGTGSYWPGYSFGGYSSVSEAWGSRNPNNEDYRKVNDHLARLQLVLRQGKPRFDVAVYWQDYGINASSSFGGGGTSGTLLSTTSAMAQNGYTYEYISPEYLGGSFASKAVYTPPATAGDLNSGTFFPYQSAYKALVLNSPQRTWIRRDAAEKILTLAKGNGTNDGLPVVIVGADCNAGCSAPTIVTQGLQTGDDAATQAAMNELYGLIGDGNALHHVIAVAAEANVPAALASFGIQPASRRATASSAAAALNIVHRQASGTDYYFLFNNSSTTAITQTLTLAGSGVPYSLDTWKGTIAPIANYGSATGGVTVTVKLPAYDVAVVAVSSTNLDGSTTPTLHASSTTADKVLYDNGQVAIRAASTGTYTTKLSDGRTVSTTVGTVPAVVPIDTWTLSVDGWGPGASGKPGDTAHTAIPSSGTITVNADSSHKLPDWTAITTGNGYPVNLSTISGIGTYTTVVNLASGWTGGHGAYLNLGSATDTSQVTVNGTVVPAYSYLDVSRIDVGPYLKDGANTIVVRVATTLSNAVKAYAPQGVSSRAAQQYGLFGPVQLIPYGQAALASANGPYRGYLPIVTH